MKKKFKNVENIHLQFEGNITNLIKYGNEITFDAKLIAEEKQLLIESLILRSCAYWEKFLDSEIVEVINLDYSILLESRGLPANTKLNKKLIKAILFSNAYIDFHHSNNIVAFFNENASPIVNPFQSFPKKSLSKIDFTYKIRNYLSHYSDFSKKKLFSELKKRGLINKRFVEPGVLLLKNKGDVFNQLVNNFRLCSIKMKKKITRTRK